MKRSVIFLLSLMILVCIAGINQTWATPYDPDALELLASGDTGIINGALYEASSTGNAGRGVYPTFLAIQGNTPVTQGYNSDSATQQFDETSSHVFNHSVLLNWLGVINLDGTDYFEFGLDADQTKNDPLLYLSDLEIYATSNPAPVNYPGDGSFGTLVYDMHDAPDTEAPHGVLFDYSLGAGSGKPDLYVNIPTSLFASYDVMHTYIVLYSRFGLSLTPDALVLYNGETDYRAYDPSETARILDVLGDDNDGPEEWSYLAGEFSPPPPAVPEPATIALLGIGLVGLAGFSRRKFKK